MCLIAKNQKNSLYTFDKSDPQNLNLSAFIENYTKEELKISSLFSVLYVTYLLHFFLITHIGYDENK